MSDLPELLDPILDFLSDRLPPTLYSILETLLSHSIQLISSLFGLASALITSNPSTWDAEKLLPPIITLLISYLALVSFYRTTGWMIRTAFAFVKWGFIFSILGGLAGYVLANGNGYGGNGIAGMFTADGIVPAIGGMILNILNGNANDGSSSNRRGTRSSRSRTQGNSNSRPKAWESWDQHQQWQYNANQNQGDPPNVQQVMSELLGATEKVVRESGWWEAAKNAANEFVKKAGENGESGSRRSTRRRKEKTTTSR